MQAYFQKLLAYNLWGHQQLAHQLESQQVAEDEASLRWFSHLLTAEQIWYHRLQGLPAPPTPLWEVRPLDTLRSEILVNHGLLEKFLTTTTDYDRVVTYHNSKGDAFSTSVEDILAHLFNHGTHHRGQILSRIRELGGTPTSLDFIFYVRTNP